MSTGEIHIEFTTKIKKNYMYKIKVIRYIYCIMNSHYLIMGLSFLVLTPSNLHKFLEFLDKVKVVLV